MCMTQVEDGVTHSTRSLDCFGYFSLFVPTNLCSHQNGRQSHKITSTELLIHDRTLSHYTN